jgi:hypothetical protein
MNYSIFAKNLIMQPQILSRQLLALLRLLCDRNISSQPDKSFNQKSVLPNIQLKLEFKDVVVTRQLLHRRIILWSFISTLYPWLEDSGCGQKILLPSNVVA